MTARSRVDALRARHDAAWRDPAAVAAHWHEAGTIEDGLTASRTRGRWWETLAATGVTLLVTREYEHLVLALRATRRGPEVTYLRLPHPSGIAFDAARGLLHVASTRNPNQVYDLAPVVPPANGHKVGTADRPLLPVRTRFLPGGLYLHDLAMIGGRLHANAVGQNAVVRLDDHGSFTRVWWPRAIDGARGPAFDRNYLQLNSIAAGRDVAHSFFSASTERRGRFRPGDPEFPVDRRGVIFSGRTREPVVRGLTRPHSARLRKGRLWVDNSGYGELGVVEDGHLTVVAKLPGWTRGLDFQGEVAFVGTSRVLPRFTQYAPGLDVATAICGVHAVDVASGRVLGSLTWPAGNQIFAVTCLPAGFTAGLPFAAGRRRDAARDRALFYGFAIGET